MSKFTSSSISVQRAPFYQSDKMEKLQNFPWKNGFYMFGTKKSIVLIVEGNSLKIIPLLSFDQPDIKEFGHGTWTFGDFGPAQKEVIEASGTGRKNYNFKMVTKMMQCYGILGKNKIFLWGMWNCLETIEWLSQDDMNRILDRRDSFDVPDCPFYEMNPESQDFPVVWLSGPPGAGKSTTGALLAKKKGYVYYEADCTMMYVNPFINPDFENPGERALLQDPLKDVPQELIAAQKLTTVNNNLLDRFDNLDFDTEIAKAVLTQQKRIGGKFVVAHSVMTRKQRECIRQLMPNCVFITLTLTQEAQEKRIKARHGEHCQGILNFLSGLYEKFERAGDNELNTYNIDVSSESTRAEIMQYVDHVITRHM